MILTNPHYTGDLVQGRSTTRSVTNKSRDQKSPQDYIIVPNTHEAIISKQDFEAVQQLIKSRKRTRPQAEKHLFTNTAYCADCERGMHFKKNIKGYICGNYNKHGSKVCSDHLVREADLCLAILNDLKQLATALNTESTFKNLETKINKQKQQFAKKIKNIDNEIDKLLKRKKKALDKYLDEEMSKEEYDNYTNAINHEINELLSEKQQLESFLQSQEDKLTLTELKKNIQDFLEFKELTPEILHRLVDRIEIKADGSPKIYYRFSGPLPIT